MLADLTWRISEAVQAARAWLDHYGPAAWTALVVAGLLILRDSSRRIRMAALRAAAKRTVKRAEPAILESMERLGARAYRLRQNPVAKILKA